ncbi:MAG: 5-deoxy-glucuronate isomerase [Clostridia bacterium]
MFIYPKFDKDGKQVITRTEGKTASMLQNITVYRLKKGESIELIEPDMESAILLVYGEITYYYEDEKAHAKREGIFEKPTCLHISKNESVGIEAHLDSEILVQSTPNERNFTSKLYRPSDVRSFVSCEGRWENTAVRDVVTIFDYSNAPYSNMVIGEVYARQGKWWSYIPHSHPQPEVYYYKFERPEGFGACFIGDKAHTIKDGSAGLFDGGYTHAQVTAPGYPMYCCWMIRHLDGNPWEETRTDDPRYAWLLEQ